MINARHCSQAPTLHKFRTGLTFLYKLPWKIIPFVFLILFTRQTAWSVEHGESSRHQIISHDDHILICSAISIVQPRTRFQTSDPVQFSIIKNI
jgi:hypothetical protein